MNRDTHWYNRFGIEEPFPWVLVVIYGVPVVAVLALVAEVYL
jgi:hypothetical protein